MFHLILPCCFTWLCPGISPVCTWLFHPILFQQILSWCFISVCLAVLYLVSGHFTSFFVAMHEMNTSSFSCLFFKILLMTSFSQTPEMLPKLILSLVGGGVDHGPVTTSMKGILYNIHLSANSPLPHVGGKTCKLSASSLDRISI